MKKHEALKFAYDNYPKGCIARFKGAPSVDHVSTGKFQISDPNGDGCWGVFSVGGNYDCFYSTDRDDNGNIDGWAEIVPQEKQKPYDSVKVKTREEAKAVFEYFKHENKTLVDSIINNHPEYLKDGFEIGFETNEKRTSFCHNGWYSNPMSFEQFTEEKGIGLAKPDGLMDGKVAIQVNNEREFKLLMEHYADKGWKACSGDEPSKVGYVDSLWSYKDGFAWAPMTSRARYGYKMVQFEDFAKEKGIKVPVFVMKSEDGVPLYAGDKGYEASTRVHKKSWYLVNARQVGYWILDENNNANRWIDDTDNSKIFSTKQAAEKWIEEQNKPKEITIPYPTVTVKVTKYGFTVTSKIDGITFKFENEDIMMITNTIKSLQS